MAEKRKRSPEGKKKGTLASFFQKKPDSTESEKPNKRAKTDNDVVSSISESENAKQFETAESTLLDSQSVSNTPSLSTPTTGDISGSLSRSLNSREKLSNEDYISRAKQEPKAMFSAIEAEKKKQRSLSDKHELWSEKYRPKTFNDLLGNQVKIDGLRDWLSSWFKIWKNKEEGKKKGRSKSSDIQDKSAFIYGRPGIGKTTAAKLIAESMGFKVLELNASDTRSKSSLKEHVHELVNNHPMQRFEGVGTKKKRMCLIMDEIDGISSGDRGGIQELLNIIKFSKIPIICIANDGQELKLKTLRGYSKNFQFDSPPDMVIFRRMKDICQQEGLQIADDALKNLISSLDGDVRGILNNLQFLSKRETREKRNNIEKRSTSIQKSSQCPSIFSMAECILKFAQEYPPNWNTLSGEQKKEYLESCPRPLKQFIDYYFNDTLFVPLLIQQNYINMLPGVFKSIPSHLHDHHRMIRIFSAAESISYSDIVDRRLRENQAWELAPLHATTSTITPSVYVRGSFQRLLPYDPQNLKFPDVLGKLSSSRKNTSELADLSTCVSSYGTVGPTDLIVDGQLTMLDHKFGEILKTQDGVDQALDLMELYSLSRSDLDTISSFNTLIPTFHSSFKNVVANTKKALTKQFKKRFGGESILSAKKKISGDDDEDDESEEELIPDVVKTSTSTSSTKRGKKK